MTSTLKQLRASAYLESATLLILVGVAVPLKHIGGYSAMVSVMGPVHGIAFVGYLWSISRAIPELGLRRAEVGKLLLAALLPLGCLWSLRVIARREAEAEVGSGE